MTLIGWIVGATLLALLALGITLAAVSHDESKACPPGWKPNTGYLQRAGSCVPR